MANKCMKKCSASPVTMEVQIKGTVGRTSHPLERLLPRTQRIRVLVRMSREELGVLICTLIMEASVITPPEIKTGTNIRFRVSIAR